MWKEVIRKSRYKMPDEEKVFAEIDRIIDKYEQKLHARIEGAAIKIYERDSPYEQKNSFILDEVKSGNVLVEAYALEYTDPNRREEDDNLVRYEFYYVDPHSSGYDKIDINSVVIFGKKEKQGNSKITNYPDVDDYDSRRFKRSAKNYARNKAMMMEPPEEKGLERYKKYADITEDLMEDILRDIEGL
tara:strand:+ start:1072 stop:1635 length:564 start_codon:yes stop_codon:yes gene_type:complete